jgi:hypothetical protein
MKNLHQKSSKNSKLKTKKRILKVLQAILNIEQHTAAMMLAMDPLMNSISVGSALRLPEGNTAIPPRSNKKKMDEFRENWLDKQEVIRLMPVSERSLYTLRKEGKLPSYTFKGKIFFKLQDVESLMRSKEPAASLAS